MMDRRTLLSALCVATFLPVAAVAQQTSILKVSGEVTATNFDGLATFLGNSTDTVIGLDIRFPVAEDAGDGGLVASVDAEGLFNAYISGSSRNDDGGTEISARDGVNFQNGANVVNGFFVVKNAGMNQGIVALYLEQADEASVLLSGKPVKDLDIDRLDPNIRKQD